jgi:hypothetical protein
MEEGWTFARQDALSTSASRPRLSWDSTAADPTPPKHCCKKSFMTVSETTHVLQDSKR